MISEIFSMRYSKQFNICLLMPILNSILITSSLKIMKKTSAFHVQLFPFRDEEFRIKALERIDNKITAIDDD